MEKEVSYVGEEYKPFIPWAGGTETYTVRQITELVDRQLPARLIVIGDTVDTDLSDIEQQIPVPKMRHKSEWAELDDTLL